MTTVAVSFATGVLGAATFALVQLLWRAIRRRRWQPSSDQRQTDRRRGPGARQRVTGGLGMRTAAREAVTEPLRRDPRRAHPRLQEPAIVPFGRAVSLSTAATPRGQASQSPDGNRIRDLVAPITGTVAELLRGQADPVEISPFVTGRYHVDADAILFCHASAEGVWLLARASGTATCRLGAIPLDVGALPITSRAKTLHVGDEIVELDDLAAEVPVAPLALADGATASLRGRVLFRAAVSAGVVCAARIVTRTHPSTSAELELGKLVGHAGEVFVPGNAARYAIEALRWHCHALFADIEEFAAALVGADPDGTITYVAMGDVAWCHVRHDGRPEPLSVWPPAQPALDTVRIGPSEALLARFGGGQARHEITVRRPEPER